VTVGSATDPDVGVQRASVAGWLPIAGVALLAVALRLVPTLRGGGLFGRFSYDGSVYYAGAAGLAHGLLPYRDFLLLHPPGILLALLPFALLGRVAGDPVGLAAARVAWVLVGAANAVLVQRILRPLGGRPALLGGIGYAVFYPAVFIDRATILEPVAATCLLGAMLLASRPTTDRIRADRAALLAGVLLGLSSGIKIWGVVFVLAFVGWYLGGRQVRRAAKLLAGAAIGVSLVCLPFFLAAPAAMWRMVVVDQLGRRESAVGLGHRVFDLTGLAPLSTTASAHPWLVVLAAAVLVAAVLLAVRTRVGRLGVLVLVVSWVVLLATPSWFVHYSGLAAAPTLVVLGGAVAELGRLWHRRLGLGRSGRLRMVPTIATLITVVALLGYAVPILKSTIGDPFPGRQLAARLAGVDGCVTTDEPTVLIETNVLQRNLARNCPLVADLGGYSYDLPTPQPVPREQNARWQQLALGYLRSGQVTILVRFHLGSGFDAVSADIVRHWPVLARVDGYVVREPRPAIAASPH
jgi:alpha-1,2-mannosyltransferase